MRCWRRFCISAARSTSASCGSSRSPGALSRVAISDAGVHRILCRNGVSLWPKGTRVRKVHTTRTSKQVRGHHIQMDVKFLTFIGDDGQKVRRDQYTAIDDAIRIRALKIYERHTQANAITSVDHVIATLPFRIREIRIDNVLCRGGAGKRGRQVSSRRSSSARLSA